MPPPPSNAAHVNSINHLQMQLHLSGLKKNATDLRKQLTQLRKTQVHGGGGARYYLDFYGGVDKMWHFVPVTNRPETTVMLFSGFRQG